MTRRRLVAGNWKMNTSRSEAIGLATQLRDSAHSGAIDVAVCPPFPWIEVVFRILSGSEVAVGAQDCWCESSGAFTGQVSPTMLSELCTLVLVGHSEHRRDAGESNQLVGLKAKAALAAGLIPVVCVGESIETRNSGEAEAWVTNQIDAVIAVVGKSELQRCSFAYEPIWAIGSGMPAGAKDAQRMATVIRKCVQTASSEAGALVRILYGGSVTPENAATIVGEPEVDGLLVGGASLRAESFMAIVAAC